MTPQDTKIAELENKIRELEKQIANKPDPAQFTHYRGAAFKRDGKGYYELCVYCPVCFIPATHMVGANYMCLRCNVGLDVGGPDLSDVIHNHDQYVKK